MTDSVDQAVLHRALLGGELLFRQLADLMPHLVWTTTADGVCDFLSRRWVEYTGVPMPEQLGNGWASQLHPDDLPRAAEVWKETVASGKDLRLEFRIRRADGEYRWFDTRAVAVRDADGTIVKWLGTNTDVHDTLLARAALQQNEERLRYVAKATHDAIYDWDMRSGETYRNDTFQRLFGVAAMTSASERWWESKIHPDDHARVVASANAAFRARSPSWSDGYRLRRADNEYAIVADRAYLLYDENSRPIRMIGAIADITASKQVEKSLRDAQARLLSVMEAGGIATWVWEVQRDELTWDEAAYRLWGRSPEDIGRLSLEKVLTMMHPEDRDRVTAASAEFFRTGFEVPVEFRPIRPDGALQWLAVKGQIERDAYGKPVRMVGVYVDMTARKEVEQSLRDAQWRLETAMAAGELASWIWDLTKDELYWDAAAYRMWGIENDGAPMSSSRVIALMHPDDRGRLTQRRTEFVEKLDDTDVEFRTIRPDGIEKWLLAKGRYVTDEVGRPIRMVGVYQDITVRKRAEESRLNSQKLEALGTLAGGIAHDFNNILLAISGNAKLAIEDLRQSLPDSHPVRRSLSEIDKASARAADLVRRILMFSHHQEARRSATPLQPPVEDALRILRPTLPAHIEIRTSYDDIAVSVAVDPIQIQQVVMNLVTNAYHAIGDVGGTIFVEVASHSIAASQNTEAAPLKSGVYARLTVRDTGAGIDPAIKARIFEPFFTTKPVGKGTGLGLAIVHGIVANYGGAIDVRSEPNRGAEVNVYLPATASIAHAEHATAASASQSAKGEHVLYVDDEEPLVFLISRVLERLGYRVTGCVDPVEAINQLRTEPTAFDAMVTDLSMRGMNGFELARAAHAIRSDLPIILTSGYLRAEDRETAERCGIRELVLKPNTVEELGAALDRVLAAWRNRNV